MFEALTERLSAVFQKLGGRGRLTEKEIDDALRQLRVALLEADVNYKVTRRFVATVKERALAPGVLDTVAPVQQVVKIVQEELVQVLGGAQKRLAAAPQAPTVVMLVGLQGSGKTTTAAKLALHLKQQGNRALLVAADVKRPAAILQLTTLGKQIDVPVYEEGTSVSAVDVCRHALDRAKELGAGWIVVDTAGRLHVDEEMMAELVETKARLDPTESLLVVDAMTGQDAVRAAEDFHQKVGLTGLILTKMDGDARGGAALSITSVTGLPIKFMGIGEKTDAFEVYHPDRLATRILGMGDMATLIEKATQTIDAGTAASMEKKLRSATFDLEDFLDQLHQVKKMGSLTQMLDMIPGMSMLTKRLPAANLEDKQIDKVEAIILSMTPQERRKPEIIGGSRRRRIASGSGAMPADVNRLLNQFQQMRKMMQQLARGKQKGLPPGLKGLIR